MIHANETAIVMVQNFPELEVTYDPELQKGKLPFSIARFSRAFDIFCPKPEKLNEAYILVFHATII